MNSSQTSEADEVQSFARRTLDWFAFLFSLVFPTIITFVYFQLLDQSGSSSQQMAYGIGKVLQFAFPFLWIAYFYRAHLSTLWRWHLATEANSHSSSNTPNPSKRNDRDHLLWGIGFGLLTAAALLAVYFLFFQGSAIGERVAEMAKQKVTSMGIASLWKYVAVGVFYTLVHSFMEEYYWRWFVFWIGRKLLNPWTSNVVSSLGFAAHHVILLGFFLGWDSPMTYVFSICIAVGGGFWAWLYARDGQLKYCWISHAIVDAAIFGLGYWMVADCFG